MAITQCFIASHCVIVNTSSYHSKSSRHSAVSVKLSSPRQLYGDSRVSGRLPSVWTTAKLYGDNRVSGRLRSFTETAECLDDCGALRRQPSVWTISWLHRAVGVAPLCYHIIAKIMFVVGDFARILRSFRLPDINLNYIFNQTSILISFE